MLRGDRNRKRANDELADLAGRRGQEWTGPELELLTRTDLTARQAAALLGRTLYAVKHMRRRIQVDPRAEALAGSKADAQAAAIQRVLDSIAEGKERAKQSLRNTQTSRP